MHEEEEGEDEVRFSFRKDLILQCLVLWRLMCTFTEVNPSHHLLLVSHPLYLSHSRGLKKPSVLSHPPRLLTDALAWELECI